MIVKTPKHPGYGKYFLAMEAPGDPPLRKNMKVITVRPNRRARIDFTTNDLVVSDEPVPELPEIDDPVDSELDLPDINDGDVGVDDLPEIDNDLSDLPDIDQTQTQSDPDQALPDDVPADIDIPDITPDGSSVDMPADLDEPDTDVDIDVPDIDGAPDVELPNDIDAGDVDLDDLPDDVPDDPDLDIPDLDDDTIANSLPNVDDLPEDFGDLADLPDDLGDDPDDLNLPDLDDDTIANSLPSVGDADLPIVDDPTQSTNINVTPDTNGEEDFTGTTDAPQSTNVAVTPDNGNGQEDYTAEPEPVPDLNTEVPPADNQQGAAPAPDDGANADNTDYTQAPAGNQNDPNAQQQPATPDANQDNANTQKRGPGLEYDSVRKYNLYKEFMKLRTAVDGYITKLEACISDDPRSNQVIKTATTKFRELYDLITDYMMMKYELCTYIQNLLFYQRQVATVQLIFALLKETNQMQKSEEELERKKKPRKTTQ